MKTKRYAAVVSAVAASALVLTGCVGGGGTEAPSSDGEIGGTLTGIFPAAFKDTYVKIAADFEKKYPEVKVDFDYQGGDIGQLVMTQLQGGTAPDILTSFPGGDPKDNADTVAPLAAQGHIAPLDVSWADQIPDGWERDFAHDGQTFAYPGALQPLTSIYNKTKLDELGLSAPETLDEVLQLCADATEAGVYAYSQPLGDAVAGPQMLTYAQVGSLVYGPDPDFDAKLKSGKTTYPDSAWVDQFEIYQQMSDAGCFGDGALGRAAEQAQSEVAAGNSLGIVHVGGALPGIKASGPDNEYLIAPMPASNDGETLMVALPGFVTTVNAKAKNPATAQAFLEFLGEPEISAIYAEGFQSVPVLPNDEYSAPAELAEFAAAVDAGTIVPLGTVQAEVQSTLNQQLQAMLLGDTTPEGVAESMQVAYEKK
ncbi:ABC transporter substrate-binding protein [Nocardioides sp. WG-D5]